MKFVAATLLFALATPAVGVASTSPRPTPADLAAAVDSFAARAISAGLAPALGVAVTLDGQVILSRSHGSNDTTAGVPAGDDTLWYVASTSKSFTGFGVALLAQQGAVALDQPIEKLLPNARWPPSSSPRELTLASFLSHTHGLEDLAIVTSAAFTGELPERCWPALLALARPTGSRDLVYSNLGYNVAAMVIDVLRPEGWRKYLEEKVFQPAGMTETFARVGGLEPRRIARPHRMRADGRFETEAFFKTDATMNSAGGHLSTLHDLARWTIVQMDGGTIDGRQVFPSEAVALSQRLIAKQTREPAKRFTEFDREGWGAGWDLGSYRGEPMVSRFGGYHSFHSHLSFLPRRRVGVVAMVNGGRGASVAALLATLAYDLEAGRPEALEQAERRLQELREEIPTGRARTAESDAQRADRQRHPLGRPRADFAGRYFAPGFGTIEIDLREGALSYRWGAVHGPVEIYDAAKSQLRIEIAGSGRVVTFTFGESGPAHQLEVDEVPFSRERPGARPALPCGPEPRPSIQ